MLISREENDSLYRLDSIQGIAWSPGGDEIWFTGHRTG